MNNWNHLCALFEYFRGKNASSLCSLSRFFPPLGSFHFCLIPFMCCIGCVLAIWISFFEQWDIWGLRGQWKNTALVVHSVTWHWLMRVGTWVEFVREKGKWEDPRASKGGDWKDDKGKGHRVASFDTLKSWSCISTSPRGKYWYKGLQTGCRILVCLQPFWWRISELIAVNFWICYR